MAEDDTFDIDIYGDDSTEVYQQSETGHADSNAQGPSPDDTLAGDDYAATHDNTHEYKQDDHMSQDAHGHNAENVADNPQQIASTGTSTGAHMQDPKQAPVQQGVKRKEGHDDRPVDDHATRAVIINELHWWHCEDDIRGWANQAGCEDELKDVTFSEHKVNGKSKGTVFVELTSAQAATALKHHIDSFNSSGSYNKKYLVTYHAAESNPYRTHPKEVPNRKEGRHNNGQNQTNFNASQGYNNYGGGNNFGNSNGGFRGRGGYNRGGGFNNNRNFSGPSSMGAMGAGGFGNPMGGFGGNMGGNMGGMNMGAMSGFNNFNRGGGMMGGMRGGGMPNRGRGGMNMGMGMPGAMGMGGMGGMGMIGGGMQGQYGFSQGSAPHFNPGFFQQGQQGGDWNSQHPAKRQRAESYQSDAHIAEAAFLQSASEALLAAHGVTASLYPAQR